MLDNNIKIIFNRAKKNHLYNDLYKNLKFNNNFSEIPFLEEHHLQKFNPSCLKKDNENVCVYFTSGTTSDPKAIYYNYKAMEYIADYIKLFCEIEGIAGNERVAVLMGQSFWGAGYFTAQGHIKSGNTVVTIDTGLSKNTIIDLLCAFKPTVISSTPSFLLELEDISKNIRLKLIETTGEMLNQKTRNKLEKIFKAKVFDAYGMTEGIVGVECNFHDGYHFFPNKVHLEIIDPKTNELLENEQWGELVITVISDSIMPIIRYKTGDICKISSKKCPCGNSNPRIWIKGRKEKVIHLHEGAKLGYNEFRNVIVGVFGQSIKFNVNVKNNKKMSILNIDINDYDKKKIEIVKSKIININYETLYLSQAGKLRMIFKYKN